MPFFAARLIKAMKVNYAKTFRSILFANELVSATRIEDNKIIGPIKLLNCAQRIGLIIINPVTKVLTSSDFACTYVRANSAQF